MDRHLSLAIFGACLTACVTVNVYFPASAAERAADLFIKDVYGTEQGDTQPGGDDAATPETRSSFEGGVQNASLWRSVAEWIIPSAQAQQPDISIASPGINALKGAMEARHQEMLPFYASGAIGLSKDGLLAIRDAKVIPLKERNTVKKLIADENADRNRLYNEIAQANGHPEWEPDIRSIFAQRWVGNAPGGWWFQTAGGNWQQK